MFSDASHRKVTAAMAVAVLALVTVATLATSPVAASPTGANGAVIESANPVAGQYIVTLRDTPPGTVRATATDLAAANNGEVLAVYRHALRGFAVTMSASDARRLAVDPQVAAVEENGVVHASITQTGATWGLDRLDQRNLPLDTSYTHTATGAGVTAYIIDTGIRTSHSDFGGRARVGIDAVGDGQNGQDCNGHGTHVAGTVGGSTYGVAKAVALVAVRVLDCSGSGSDAGVIAGIDWVTANRSGPSVANMSLGGSASVALDTAVRNSIASGVTYGLAAGNENTNACNGSPSRVTEALTVGATTTTDARSSFSNFGTCVDVFAPGSNITSDWSTNDTATNTISGTSMATPHVVGAAALYLQAHPGDSPTAVATAILAASTPNKVTSPGTGSPNRLLFTGTNVAPPPPPPPPPPPTGPANNAFASAQALSGNSGTATGTNVGATKETGEPAHAGNAGGASVWYRWTAPANGTLTVDTAGSAFDTLLAAYTGTAVNALAARASNDDTGGTLQSRISYAVTAGTTYRVAIDGYGGAKGATTLRWSFAS